MRERPDATTSHVAVQLPNQATHAANQTPRTRACMQAAHGRPGKWRASSVLPQQTLMHKFAGVGVHQPTANQRLHKAASHIPVGSLLQQKLHVDAHCFHALFTEFTPTTGRTWVHNHEQLTKAVHSAIRCPFAVHSVHSVHSVTIGTHACTHGCIVHHAVSQGA